MTHIIAYLSIFVMLFVAEFLYLKLSKRFNISDVPNDRSSHSQVICRGGGVIFFIAAWLWFAFIMGYDLHHFDWRHQGAYLVFLIGLTLVAVISFIDDIRSVHPYLRLVVEFIAMFAMFYAWGILDTQFWWLIILALIFCVGIINAINFMDGINGITGVYALSVLVPLINVNFCNRFIVQSYLFVLVIAVCVFLFFNFRKRAVCFAGDVGSVSIAFLLLFALGKLISASGDFTFIVFLVVYGVDTILTLVHRIMLHEKLSVAHRKHAFQIMSNELHIPQLCVASFYGILQLVINGIFLCLPDTPKWHWTYLIAVTTVLCIAYVLFMKKYFHLHKA